MVEYVKFNDEVSKIKIYRFSKYSFSSIELKHLFIALIFIILTIFVFQNGGISALLYIFSDIAVLKIFLVYILTIGLGFLLHELGHKLVAQYYGFISEFRADFLMLFFMFIMAAFSPIIFLAPGAVIIHGRLSLRQNGIISVAGPVVNLVLAIIFIILNYIISPMQNSYLGFIFSLGIWINAFLGVFNMLPFWVLDGKKVLAWSKSVYFSVFFSLILILVLSYRGFF